MFGNAVPNMVMRPIGVRVLAVRRVKSETVKSPMVCEKGFQENHGEQRKDLLHDPRRLRGRYYDRKSDPFLMCTSLESTAA
uniref:Uncharacterized protein n=1 Tax=Ascaris lumbricoides TaxID=6252 RepID=A0A0M3HF55_ASCLU